MKILVTGGAGFIGSHLVDKLLVSGARVRVLDNLSTGKASNLPRTQGCLEFVHGDIRDRETVTSCVIGMDAMVHLAAVASVQASVEDPIGTHSTNFTGTLNLLEAARTHQIARFILASSAAVYGDTVALPVAETANPNPLSPYATDKLSSEYYMRYYHRKYGLTTTAFRFFNIYGPRQDPSSPYSGVISLFVDGLMHSKPVTIYGDGHQTRDFVYVDDLANLLVRATRGAEGNGGIFNVGTGQRHSLLQLLDLLENLSGKKIERHLAPVRTGDIRDSCADVTRLRATFGCPPATPFELGLKQLLMSLGV